ncbi:fused MFS/spermidine synthase [Pokkaliibacter sp. CJK22405]|uniref:fused MFS/spermidine synthase n=1 Tax=Pokkaliibacter sp. CJK22405 TaxID=3384615 RepID=UPI0039852C5A
MRQLLIYVAAAWSGFFVMGVELLGGRLLAPFFGSSIFVWGAVITVFMAFLSLGYLLGGRFSLKNPGLSRLGILLIAEALLAAPLLICGNEMLEWVSARVGDPRYGSLLASLMLFGLPTLLSGMVSPYAVRLLIHSIHAAGNSAGRLYFASTVGSAAGTIVTSFYLVLYLPINSILGLLMAISLAVGSTLFLASRVLGSNASPST